MKLEYLSKSTSQTEQLGRGLAEMLEKNGGKAFVAMKGEMGVGKTAFTRGFASYFGIMTVKSPTYTVLNEYRGRKNIHHFDFYRISSEDDLYSIGYDDAVDSDGYCVAEWSENVEDLLPQDRVVVCISRVSNGSVAYDTEDDSTSLRKITIDIPFITE